MEVADIVQLASALGVNGVLAIVSWKLWGALQASLGRERSTMDRAMSVLEEALKQGRAEDP